MADSASKPTTTESATAGKGKATPSRKSQEAAHRKPLVGDRSADGRKAQRAAMQEDRRKAREGMMAGDDRYLTARDKGPQRRLARDVVDSRRFTIGELLFPGVLLSLVFETIKSPLVSIAVAFTLYALLLLMVLDVFLLTRKAKKLITAKYGAVERGISWYIAMRALQLRVMRLPKPVVKRGSDIN